MLQNAILIGLTVFFIHACTWKGHIFSFIRDYTNPDRKLWKPIYSCPICMTPYYGTLIYFVILKQPFAWQQWILTIFAAAGLNVFSVIAVYAKDYFKSRTRKEKECCE